jgi:hypothetical protein
MQRSEGSQQEAQAVASSSTQRSGKATAAGRAGTRSVASVALPCPVRPRGDEPSCAHALSRFSSFALLPPQGCGCGAGGAGVACGLRVWPFCCFPRRLAHRQTALSWSLAHSSSLPLLPPGSCTARHSVKWRLDNGRRKRPCAVFFPRSPLLLPPSHLTQACRLPQWTLTEQSLTAQALAWQAAREELSCTRRECGGLVPVCDQGDLPRLQPRPPPPPPAHLLQKKARPEREGMHKGKARRMLRRSSRFALPFSFGRRARLLDD